MKDQLTIEHLGRRLCAGLKCQDEEGKIGILSSIDYNGMPVEFMNYTISYDWKVTPHSCNWNVYNDGNWISRIKPILRPLSYLTKEIEHNGEKFIPALILFSVSAKEEDQFDIYGTIPKYWDLSLKTEPKYWEYWQIQKLIEWHFVIDEPKGTWIDVNTLETNPYK